MSLRALCDCLFPHDERLINPDTSVVEVMCPLLTDNTNTSSMSSLLPVKLPVKLHIYPFRWAWCAVIMDTVGSLCSFGSTLTLYPRQSVNQKLGKLLRTAKTR